MLLTFEPVFKTRQYVHFVLKSIVSDMGSNSCKPIKLQVLLWLIVEPADLNVYIATNQIAGQKSDLISCEKETPAC